LEAFDTIYPLPDENDPDADWFVSRLSRTEPSPLVRDALARLDAHWDRIATVLAAGATGTQVELGRFWQSLPGVLEVAAQQCDAALEASRSGPPAAQVAEREREASAERIAELGRLLGLAREEIADRDRRIAALLASTSWRITAPMRFFGRRLGR
jgi:lipopolysaccharide transport system ATP-binding protein